MENPFIVNGNIPREYFCDREKESDRLVKLLVNGNNVLLISPRRMGKTGLIYHCFDFPEIKDSYITIFVDILQTTSLQEFTFLLGKAVFEALMPRGKKLLHKFTGALKSLTGKFTYDPITGAPSFSVQLGDISSPAYTLDEIFKFIKDTDIPCIVAIDEFQQITYYPEKNVEAILRTHIQRLSNCHFIYSGSSQHLMSELFVYPNRPFYNSTSTLHLDPIPLQVYSVFVKSLFAKFNRQTEEEVVRYLYDKFEGTTFYMQAILNQAFYMTKEGDVCSMETVEKAMETVVEASAELYRGILASLKLRQKELLVAIAKNEPAPNILSVEFMKKNGLQSASSVQAAARKLSDINLISKTVDGYKLTDKFLSLWIRQIY